MLYRQCTFCTVELHYLCVNSLLNGLSGQRSEELGVRVNEKKGNSENRESIA